MSTNKSVMSFPSGSLSNPLVTGAPGDGRNHGAITVLTGPTGSGKSLALARSLYGVTHTFLKLPEGQTGWHVRSAEKESRKEITARLNDLLETKFDGQDVRVVTEVFQRGDTPGTMNALRFCDRYLMSGGDLESLGKVGHVLLPLNTDLERLTEENLMDVTTVSIALYDAGAVITTEGAVELAFELVGRGAEIASVISERGITDAAMIRSLLENMDGVKSAVHGGVL